MSPAAPMATDHPRPGSSLHKRETPIARMCRRGELAPRSKPDINELLYRTALRLRQCAAGDVIEFARAMDDLHSYDRAVARMIDLVVLQDKHVSAIDDPEFLADTNATRRKKIVVARVHRGLRRVAEFFASR